MRRSKSVIKDDMVKYGYNASSASEVTTARRFINIFFLILLLIDYSYYSIIINRGYANVQKV